MKVLMQGRFEITTASGGDRVQIENTAKELKKLGVDVDIIGDYTSEYDKYDIIHVFQLDWTPETHFFVKEAKAKGKPVVMSPIHHKVEEVKKFDDICVYDYRRISKFVFREQHQRDTFKNVYRSLLNKKKIKPTMYSVFHGLKNMHIETLSLSDVVLVQTELEANDLKNTYGVDIKWELVPNGVGEQFINISNFKNPFEFDDYIFVAGRIEPRKNQLNIIKAISEIRKENNIDLKLVILGTPNPINHFEYTLRFRNLLKKNDWITYIKKVPYEKMPAYYKFAKVCVSASWFETTGLTLLEALYCGTNAVASSPRAKEVLGDLISYCEPDNIESIKVAIQKEYLNKRPKISEEMRREYTWENTAKKTLEVYEDLLKKW